MLMMQAAVSLQSLLSHRAALPVAGGAFAGLAFALFRAPLRPFGIRESESLMNFSSLGSLRCICGTSHPEVMTSDRREFCRSCGCEVVETDESLLNKQISKAEAHVLTRELRQAAIRASWLQLPASITSVAELHKYLAGDSKKMLKVMPPKPPAALDQPQVQ